MTRKYRVTVNGTVYEVEVQPMEEGESAPSQPVKLVESVKTPIVSPSKATPAAVTSQPAPASAAGGNTVDSPMPGKIIRVIAQQGQNVGEGDVLMILEAMKMENEIVAPVSGVVTEMRAKEGASVNSGDVLAVIGG